MIMRFALRGLGAISALIVIGASALLGWAGAYRRDGTAHGRGTSPR